MMSNRMFVHKPVATRARQATKMTRQELREFSPSGKIHMDGMMGKSFTAPFLAGVFAICLGATFAIDWMIANLMP